MNILMTGGTGFLGKALIKSLLSQQAAITVLTRNPEKLQRHYGRQVTAITQLSQITPEQHFDAIINLAGAPIFAAPWTDVRKQILRNSRLHITQQLIDLIARLQYRPAVLISGSAIGYYGEQGDYVLHEDTLPVPDFSQALCADWENTALQAEDHGVRVCLIRTGLVLGAGGGMLQRLLLPFKLGLGGQLGHGQQWMSWIHLTDWVRIVHAMLHDKSMHGPYNATAPTPVRNAEFTQTLARALHRPARFQLSAWVLQTLLGEMASLLLGSQRVQPERLLAQQFQFQYPELNSALAQILHKAKAPILAAKAEAQQVNH